MSTEIVWTVVGYDVKQQRNVALNYLQDTASQALKLCQKLHPSVDVYFVRRSS